MENVAVIVMYGLPGTGVVALGCAFTPEGHALHMVLSPELSPDSLAAAHRFFEWLEVQQDPQSLFVPHPDGRGATVAAPRGEEFGFEPLAEGCMLAPLSAEASARDWLTYAFSQARTTTLDSAVQANIADLDSGFQGLG